MFTFLPILIVVALALAVCSFWLYLKNKQLEQENKGLEKNPQLWKAETQEQLKDRNEFTSQIFSELEDETQKIIHTSEQDLTDFEKTYHQRLEEATQKFTQAIQTTLTSLNSQLTQSKDQNAKFLDIQQKQIIEWQQAMETETKNRVNEFLENFETNMAQFFTKAEQTSLDNINLEIKSARSLIDSYKAQQLNIVEENIVAVLERTLSIILTQKLTLKDQLDLVYEALEKAKQEKFFV